eukprot:Gb_15050 [translate_table: standard]
MRKRIQAGVKENENTNGEQFCQFACNFLAMLHDQEIPWFALFAEDGRTGTFVIGNNQFSVSLLDLPCIVESYKTYDDSVLLKTSDIGQMIMVREGSEESQKAPSIDMPELVQRVEKDLLSIMAGGTAHNDWFALKVQSSIVRCLVIEQEEDADDEGENEGEKRVSRPPAKVEAPGVEMNDEEDRTESDDSDDSM